MHRHFRKNYQTPYCEVRSLRHTAPIPNPTHYMTDEWYSGNDRFTLYNSKPLHLKNVPLGEVRIKRSILASLIPALLVAGQSYRELSRSPYLYNRSFK